MKTKLEIALEFAPDMHRSVNHKYDTRDYKYHLDMVYGYAAKYSYLITGDADTVFAACYCHDLIEDCRLTYNDIKSKLGLEIAEITYALTNEKGKTRKERANEKYYANIIACENAAFVKICDRLANVKYSKMNADKNSSMYFKYKAENPSFIAALTDSDNTLKDMFIELENLFMD